MLVSVVQQQTTQIEIKPLSSLNLMMKRLMDICISICALPIALPLVIFGCIATFLTSKGSTIFKQKRVGLDGKPFTMYKIRTMVFNKNGYINHTTKDDDRITKIGAILRKTKIDELPQILNVILGEMSIIGPRPERIEIVEELNKKNINYKFRHNIKPGITGWAQVHKPLATPDDFLEKLDYDLYYINNYSLSLDIKILAKTIGVVKNLESL